MAVHLWQKKLSYFSVPKIACTSIKSMFFLVENGRPFQRYVVNGKQVSIHNLYPSAEFGALKKTRIQDHWRMAIVRDPIKRLLSCYSNRVVFHKELSLAKSGKRLEEFDLPPDPDLSLFIKRLDEYCVAVPSISHHSRPMTSFLGKDPQFYTHLFDISQLDLFVEKVGERLEMAVSLPHMQRGGPKMETSALTSGEIDFLKNYYSDDYETFVNAIKQL